MVKAIQLNVAEKKSTISYDQFIKLHKSQLTLIPKIYWSSLYQKVTQNIFDLDKNIQLDIKKITYSNEVIKKQITARVSNKNGLRQDDPQNIFLINHLVHFHANEGRELIKEMIQNRSPLINYLKKLMDINDCNVCTFINKFLDESWRYVIPFTIKTKGNKSLPIWSITEQIGMAIKHSFSPNFQMVTFQYLNLKRIYSVLFPIVSILNYNDEVTRDYTFFEKLNYEKIKLNAQMQQEYLNQLKHSAFPRVFNEINSNLRSPMSAVVEPMKWSVEDETELLKQTLIIPWQSDNSLDYYQHFEKINYQQNEPTTLEFFDKRGFIEPHSMIRFEPANLKCTIASKKQIKVYCDDKQIVKYLSDVKYVFVNDRNLANIWWYKQIFFEFSKMYANHPNCLINHFPLGHLLNDKSVLPALCRRTIQSFHGNFDPLTLESYPLFIPTTFDLDTELVKFVSYFTKREQRNLDNHWILKPTNLVNSADVFVTNNLNAIIRIRGSSSRVACKYISNPLLFFRSDIMNLVKFELRYFVVLTSVLPLKLFVYRAFQVEFANKPYDLSKNLYNQEMHLTDMSIFKDQVKRYDIDHIEFINRFNYQFQYTEFDFETIDDLTMTAIRELFELSTELFPFSAINPNVASSALYRIDVLLNWSESEFESTQFEPLLPIRPNIIEVNLNPDCELICKKYSNFYNDVFNLMFLNDEENCNFRYI